jgi:SPP1 family predicted phage head-tail adaptor
MAINSRKLRHQVLIEQPVNAANDLNENVVTWTAFATLRAEVVTSPGREAIRASQTVSFRQTLFRTRYIPGVTTAMRLKFGADIYQIVSATNVNAGNRELELVCQTSK